MSRILAKSHKKEGKIIYLAQHVKDLLNVFSKIKVNIMDEKLREIIETSIIIHDFGKSSPAFQIRSLKNKDYEPTFPYYNLPHSLLSILMINQEELRELYGEEYKNLIVSAVAYHHWRENFPDILTHSNEIGKFYLELDNIGYLENVINNLQEELREIDPEKLWLIKIEKEIIDGLLNDVPFYEYAIPPYQLYWLPKMAGVSHKCLKDWILISGFLQRCDHFASFCEEEDFNYEPEIKNLEFKDIKSNVYSVLKKKNKNIQKIWQIDKVIEDDNKDKNLILIAPTGFGKTEFAFLWANGKKFFYTLPLRSAVNQNYSRANGIFNSSGRNLVGLIHSDADVFLLDDGGESQANFNSYDLARQLAFPVMISTGDQFFPYALKPPGYEKIYATFSYSKLVIDEVQAYNPKAVAIIVKFIDDIYHLGGNFLLMTATFPEFVRKEIIKRIGDNNYNEINIYDERYDEFKNINKHKICIKLIKNNSDENKPDFSLPNEEIVNILDNAIKGKRILVIANTIFQTQDIYKKIMQITQIESKYNSLKNKIWLLHSKFTIEDRKEKEEMLKREFNNPKDEGENEAKILIATQVVEASLDIDADILFTEIAPMDSLVQRMGRVLRRYGPLTNFNEIPKPEENNVFIWLFANGIQSGMNYVYDNDIVLLTFKILSDYPDLMDEDYYKKWIIDINSNLKKRDKKDKILNNIFDENNQNLSFDKLISEYDKFRFVLKIYNSIPREHKYLVEFYKTLDILDAGFMSERKEEAQKIFREIYSFSLIPEEKREDFINKIKEFFINETIPKKYSFFKKEVLTRFLVSDSVFNTKSLNKIEEWIYAERELDDFQENLIKWCKNIYFIKGSKYDENIGFLKDDKKNSNFSII